MLFNGHVEGEIIDRGIEIHVPATVLMEIYEQL